MSNTDVLRFKTKFNLKFMNGLYSLSGFTHLKSIQMDEEEFDVVMGSGIERMTEKEWNDFVEDYPELQETMREY
jgi:hypothetical protein